MRNRSCTTSISSSASACARVLDIGIGHRGVLAHDVHAADLPGVHGVHDLDDGEPRVRIERRCPQCFEPRSYVGGVADRLVVGIHHRNQADVGGALHVVLSAQRMQTGAGAADLTGDHRQRDQAARVVGAVHVLRNSHAPEDHRRARRREHPRHRAQRLRIDAAHGRHRLGAEARDVVAKLGVTARAVRDELRIDEILLDDRMHHRVQHRDVAVGLELQVVRRVPRQLRAARIGEDQLRAVLDGVLHPCRGDRMVRHRVRADQEHHLGLQHVHHRIRHRTRADAFEQCRDARRMAKPRAVIDVVGAKAGADELLEEVSLFVAALRRAETGERPRAARVADARAARRRQARAPRPTSLRGTPPAGWPDRR